MDIRTDHHREISDDFVDALRLTYSRGKTNGMSICDRSESAIAYALNELGDNERTQYGRHLRSCRDCLTLVLDVRLSLKEAADRPKTLTDSGGLMPAALAAAADAVESARAPRNRLRSVGLPIFSFLRSPKLIAGLAACSILFFVWFNLPVEKDTVVDIDVIRKKISQPAEKQKPVTKVYQLHLKQEDSAPVESNREPAKKTKSPWVTPLETIALKDLRLMGVMLTKSGNLAIVKDANDKEYIIATGERIGVNSGRVIRILAHKVIIEENVRDQDGAYIKVRKELTLASKPKF